MKTLRRQETPLAEGAICDHGQSHSADLSASPVVGRPRRLPDAGGLRPTGRRDAGIVNNDGWRRWPTEVHRANYVSAAGTSYVTRSDSAAGRGEASFVIRRRSSITQRRQWRSCDNGDASHSCWRRIGNGHWWIRTNLAKQGRRMIGLTDTHYDYTVSYSQHITCALPSVGASKIFFSDRQIMGLWLPSPQGSINRARWGLGAKSPEADKCFESNA